MKAQDIMTRDVTTVSLKTPVREIAEILTQRRYSGLPVVSESGEVVGIVSEGDLLHRTELGTERKRKWWLQIFADPEALAREFTKAHGLTAADVMSRPVVSVSEDAELVDVAQTLDKKRVKRVPVLRNGKLAGLITRSDLVRALTRAPVKAPSPAVVGDADLDKAIRDRFGSLTWLDSGYVNVSVSDGVVALGGFVGSAEQKRALRILIEEVEGVRRVEDRLIVGFPMRSGV